MLPRCADTFRRSSTDRCPVNCMSPSLKILLSSPRVSAGACSRRRAEVLRVALVSIITPAWNAAAFIGEAIASVRAQTMPDWEMLVVDDCSTDRTAQAVEHAAATDSRIRLLRQPKNGGPALALQAWLDRADGRFIAFLDSDDLWLPGKLERQLQFMLQKRAALSYTAFR